MSSLLHQLLALFERRERWQLFFLTIALIFRAAFETVGVASVAPFMAAIADPTAIQRNFALRGAYAYLGFDSTASFLIAMGSAVVAVLAVSNAISAIALWAMLRFSWGSHHRISMRLLRGYLAQPYSFFTERNTASLNEKLLSEVQLVIHGVLIHALNIVARSLVVVALVGLLVFLEPVLASLMVVVLGGVYGSLYWIVRQKQGRLGRERAEANLLRFKIAGEAFGGIKDVKVLQREATFTSRFADPSIKFAVAMASNGSIAQLPRYLLETVAFGGIVLIALYYLQRGDGIADILPVLGLYAFAGYRLMPELQQLFAGVAQIRFNRPALDHLVSDLARCAAHPVAQEQLEIPPLTREFRLESVSFFYANATRPAIRDLSLSIPANRTMGIVGTSGSGKTTLVDILLGLYRPTTGRLLVDGIELTENSLRSWRQQVGYVPQHIFLSDDTIAANIAFGVPPQEVDLDRVVRASRTAHLHEFVGTLPDGYETAAGERGVRLSGGQRQRIGIARALYNDPPVLVFDEATSALDGATEGTVMDAIRGLAGQKTIILIAHRLTTLQECDTIVLLENGRVADMGSYRELETRSVRFRAMSKRESNGQLTGGQAP